MFGHHSITYVQPQKIIVSKVLLIFASRLRILLISCLQTLRQKGHVKLLKCLILLSASFDDGERKKPNRIRVNKSADILLRKTRLQPHRKSMCQERSYYASLLMLISRIDIFFLEINILRIMIPSFA